MFRPLIRSAVVCFAVAATLRAQQSEQDIIRQLTQRLEESERRIQALEQKLGMTAAAAASPTVNAVTATNAQIQAPVQAQVQAPVQAAAAAPVEEMQGHNMEIPGGGPVLNIRGFFDFDFGTGSIANPLIFPIASNGCETCGNPETQPHTAFQAGEFDLLMTSKLSDHLSFVAETVFGAGTTNEFSVDLERYQLTYRLNDYFSISGGRF